MALDRKVEGLLALRPDIAVVSECAEPERLRLRSQGTWIESDPVWIGRNPHKGLAVFAFNGYKARLADGYYPSLRYVAPVHIDGPRPCNLLAVWAQNASAGGIRKYQLGPLRRSLSRYKDFLTSRSAIAPRVLSGPVSQIWQSANRDSAGRTESHTARSHTIPGSSSSGMFALEGPGDGMVGAEPGAQPLRAAALTSRGVRVPNREKTRRALPSKIFARSAPEIQSIGST